LGGDFAAEMNCARQVDRGGVRLEFGAFEAPWSTEISRSQAGLGSPQTRQPGQERDHARPQFR
jgi:hypothetical protein